MTHGSKLAIALRRRFPGAAGKKNLMRALGIDADLLKPAAPGGGNNDDRLQQMRTAIEGILGKLGLSEGGIKSMLEILDQHAPSADTRVPDDDPQAGRVREIAGDDELQKARDFLIGLGLSSADADEALRLAAGGGNASDVLPLNGLRGGRGGAISGQTRLPGERLAADDFGGRIIVAPDYSPDRSRGRPVRWPSEKAMEDYNRRFGGSHIVDG